MRRTLAIDYSINCLIWSTANETKEQVAASGNIGYKPFIPASPAPSERLANPLLTSELTETQA